MNLGFGDDLAKISHVTAIAFGARFTGFAGFRKKSNRKEHEEDAYGRDTKNIFHAHDAGGPKRPRKGRAHPPIFTRV